MLLLGDVQTAILRHSGGVSRQLTEDALSLLPGEQVRVSERPIGHAISPNKLVGVDCRIEGRKRRVRGVGTLTGRVRLTGGRVLQGSARARIEPGTVSYRHAWAHYLARPGVVETIGRNDPRDLAEAHLAAGRQSSTMGLGAFAGRLLSDVQRSSVIDAHLPMKAGRTTLRWAALVDKDFEGYDVGFTLRGDGTRTVLLMLGPQPVDDIVDLCEDLALHDWLLTALVTVIDQSQIGVEEPAQAVKRLRPAVDHLLHLWMPAARLGALGRSVWADLESHRGLSRQWEASVQRIRDQMAMAAALSNGRVEEQQLFP
ncbi:SCO2521 family protein [Actinoplanes sp. NPDC051861]|uniref:SCO2521 family protein n=1 Tax=Actinoplanes sp. NPDC051861 TaxID=3155170 RepID=UPI00344719E8